MTYIAVREQAQKLLLVVYSKGSPGFRSDGPHPTHFLLFCTCHVRPLMFALGFGFGFGFRLCFCLGFLFLSLPLCSFGLLFDSPVDEHQECVGWQLQF
jgi:hypothetical protein